MQLNGGFENVMFKQLVKYLGLMISIEIYEIDPSDYAAFETFDKTSEYIRESQLLFAFFRHFQGYNKMFSVIKIGRQKEMKKKNIKIKKKVRNTF